MVSVFKRPKNREDSSKFDDFWTKRIVSARPISGKIFERTKRTKSFRKIRKFFKNFFEKIFEKFFEKNSTKSYLYNFKNFLLKLRRNDRKLRRNDRKRAGPTKPHEARIWNLLILDYRYGNLLSGRKIFKWPKNCVNSSDFDELRTD